MTDSRTESNRLKLIRTAVLALTVGTGVLALPAMARAADPVADAAAAVEKTASQQKGEIDALEAKAHAADEEDHEKAGVGEVLSPSEKGLVTAVTTLVVFVALLLVLSKFAFGPIAKALKEREDKIRIDIETAEKSRMAAEARLKEYEARLARAETEAREILTKATADAERTGAVLKAQAQKEIEEARARSLRDIENDKKAALAEIHEHAVTLSTAIAEKILKRSLNSDDQRDLVRSSLEQLAGVRQN